ncbi:MAG: DUF2200 domain-containing protein [Dysgonamonadaceae bacterium]|jgi:hypothetical protein|nr:DUF2200 domain-containing protein [Dysgonamonadaceae bacterium]
MRDIFKISFSSIYPLYLQKITKKGQTKTELDTVIEWLTGFDSQVLLQLISSNVSLEEFLNQAQFNENARLITGTVCGCRVEEIEDEKMRKLRYLDKLVDELAKGWKMDKIIIQ